MTQDLWTKVDAFAEENMIGSDPVLEAVLRANAEAGLPAIDVSPTQGRLLEIFARSIGAGRILEVGTLGGYSTICMARALPNDGRIVTLEFDPHHAAVARKNFEAAGVADRIEVIVGPAADSLTKIAEADQGPFDLVFIDADKDKNPVYLDWAMKLTRPGSLVICDNVVREGRIVDPDAKNPFIEGSREAYRFMGRHPRLVSTALQTVGSKGYDGFAVGIVTG